MRPLLLLTLACWLTAGVLAAAERSPTLTDEHREIAETYLREMRQAIREHDSGNGALNAFSDIRGRWMDYLDHADVGQFRAAAEFMRRRLRRPREFGDIRQIFWRFWGHGAVASEDPAAAAMFEELLLDRDFPLADRAGMLCGLCIATRGKERIAREPVLTLLEEMVATEFEWPLTGTKIGEWRGGVIKHPDGTVTRKKTIREPSTPIHIPRDSVEMVAVFINVLYDSDMPTFWLQHHDQPEELARLREVIPDRVAEWLAAERRSLAYRAALEGLIADWRVMRYDDADDVVACLRAATAEVGIDRPDLIEGVCREALRIVRKAPETRNDHERAALGELCRSLTELRFAEFPPLTDDDRSSPSALGAWIGKGLEHAADVAADFRTSRNFALLRKRVRDEWVPEARGSD